jgi:hypothetical protein
VRGTWPIRIAGACLALLSALAPALKAQESVSVATEPARSGASGPDFDSWRVDFSARLNQTVAGLQTQGEKTGQLVVTWGDAGRSDGTPGLTSLLGGRENRSRFPIITGILRENGLPASLLGVAAVESGFDPVALSPKGARGLWQLMPATARRYGLVVQPQRDERTDPIKSTYAAAQYMKDLFEQFQDWPLALAAYNAGEDRVERALRQAGARDFWTLRRYGALPEETLRYVPAVLARSGADQSQPAIFSATDGPSAAEDFRSSLHDPAPRPGQVVFATTAPLTSGSPLSSQN